MKCKLILRFMRYKCEFHNVRVWLVSIVVLEAMRPRPVVRGRGHAFFWPRGQGRDQHPCKLHIINVCNGTFRYFQGESSFKCKFRLDCTTVRPMIAFSLKSFDLIITAPDGGIMRTTWLTVVK
jgi:hypothetical protein